MHLNGELLGTLCGKRQDTALVWIINILLHSLACISQLLHSWAAFSLAYGSWKYHTHLCNNSRYCMLTRVIRYMYSYVNKNAFRRTLECARLFCAWSNVEYCMSKSISVHAKDTYADRSMANEDQFLLQLESKAMRSNSTWLASRQERLHTLYQYVATTANKHGSTKAAAIFSY